MERVLVDGKGMKACSDVGRGAAEAESLDLVSVVFELLAEMGDPETMEMLLALLAALATYRQLHQFIIKREKNIKQILNLMKEAPSQECVFYCARICQSLCQGHRRNKRTLLEGGLVLIIRDLLEGGLQNPARQVCQDVNGLLAVVLPQHEVLCGVQVSASHSLASASAEDSIHTPSVKWSQNSFRVLLTVTVQGAKESDFNIADSSVHFRCQSGGKLYGLDFMLFDAIVPDKSRVMVHHGEVILSLAKRIRGKWSRLLNKHQECAKLRTDFDKLVDSSDSELDEPENITMLSRKKKIFPVLEGPQPVLKYSPPSCEQGSNSSNSQSDEDDILGSNSEDERFGDPTETIDPLAVVDDIIGTKAT